MKIFNLSSLELSTADTSLLCRGLNFARINKPNPFLLFKDLNRYIRNLTLKRFFYAKQNKSITGDIDPFPSISSIPSPNVFEYDGDIIDVLESKTGEEDALNLFTQHLATSSAHSASIFQTKVSFLHCPVQGPIFREFL